MLLVSSDASEAVNWEGGWKRLGMVGNDNIFYYFYKKVRKKYIYKFNFF